MKPSQLMGVFSMPVIESHPGLQSKHVSDTCRPGSVTMGNAFLPAGFAMVPVTAQMALTRLTAVGTAYF